MAITLQTVLAYNHRARKWSFKGDGATATAVIPNDGAFRRAGLDTNTREKAVSTAWTTITKSDYDSSGGGLLVPTAGAAKLTVNSTTVNADGTLTIVFSTAPGNTLIVTGYTVWNQERTQI